MAACMICSCLLMFTPSARADITQVETGTKDTNDDHHDRLSSLATAQRLQLQDGQDRRRGTSAGSVEPTDASHERFYDATSWAEDDVSLPNICCADFLLFVLLKLICDHSSSLDFHRHLLSSSPQKQQLKRLLGHMDTLLPRIDLDILYARYQEAAANVGDHQRQHPRRRRLTEEVDTEDIGGDRRLRKRGTRKSATKSKSKNSKKKDKWADEATVYWGSKSSDVSNSDSNDDTGDDWVKKNKKKRSSDEDSRKSRKKSRTKKKRSSDADSRNSRKESHNVNDYDYSDSDDKRSRQKKKDSGSNKKKSAKSSFKPQFGPSFRDSQDEVDLFHGIIKKKKEKRSSTSMKKSGRKKGHR